LCGVNSCLILQEKLWTVNKRGCMLFSLWFYFSIYVLFSHLSPFRFWNVFAAATDTAVHCLTLLVLTLCSSIVVFPAISAKMLPRTHSLTYLLTHLLTYLLTYPVSNLLSGAYGQISYCYENAKTKGRRTKERNASELIYVGRRRKEQYSEKGAGQGH